MLTSFVLFLVTMVSFVHGSREKLKCTLFISRNTENSKDHTLFLHVEKFLLRHETGEVLSGFLDKGNLTVGIRYIISADNKIKLDYLYLQIKTNSNDKHFLASAMHDMDKKKFLASVRNAFYKAYYGGNSKEKSNEDFDAMMEDKIIGSYLKKIEIRPLIMYTEMSVTSVGIDLNLIEISSADNETCFLNKLYKEKTKTTDVEDKTISSNDKHTLQLKSRSFVNSEDSGETDDTDDETDCPCASKKKSRKLKNKSEKCRHLVKDETDADDTDDIDEDTSTQCDGKKGSTKQNTKKCKLNVKDETDETCGKNKKTKKQKNVEDKTKKSHKENKKQTKKRGMHVKQSQLDAELEESEVNGEEESVDLETHTDDTDDIDEEASCPCGGKKGSTKQSTKKRNLNIKNETEETHGKNKKPNKQKNVKVKSKKSSKEVKKQTKKRSMQVKFNSKSQSDIELEETEVSEEEESVEPGTKRNQVQLDADDIDDIYTESNCPCGGKKGSTKQDTRRRKHNVKEESVEFETKSLKTSSSGTNSKLFQLLANEINNSEKNNNDKSENAENEDTEDERDENIQERSLVSKKIKSTSRNRNHLDVETHKHITEHLVSDEDEKLQNLETGNEEEENDTSKEEDEDDAEVETDEEEIAKKIKKKKNAGTSEMKLRHRKLERKKSKSCPCDNE